MLQVQISNGQLSKHDVAMELLVMTIEIIEGDRLENTHPIVYKALTDQDSLYMYVAMRERNRLEFIKAMEKEVHDQMANNNFIVVHKLQVS